MSKSLFEPLPTSRPPRETEEKILETWRREKIFEETLRRTKGGKPFVFYEGPPTANGMPHTGHVLTRVMKDLWPRYKTMDGFSVARKGTASLRWRGLPSGMGTSSMKWQPSMIMRATQKKRMSKPVTRRVVG